MSFIRGKIEVDREVRPREIIYGDLPYLYCDSCQEWVDDNHEIVEVTVTTLGDMMRDYCTRIEKAVVPPYNKDKE